ncbi:enoyl-CoA hydratase/isomerase family protein [Alteromonas lipolytica]|uniref:Enoyl-CoA hydratase n=1 Tax=Alteromonas lipolytica TaxID=1856405 RepID=A0A1E8FBN3_9ALTE|nr:enoyl-CoA hydratase/isomerase family protein [Alteromonas lipolytica]OFI33347.1 hypothetical protein BFC17_03540 [Alteromonas lipolytica]GGF60527.1 enoyl-CoA hydratase [Alteromonas lipolytica]
MTDSAVTLSIHDNIASICINRPERKNAMSQAMWLRLYELLCEVEQDPEVRVVVLTGSGGCFSAGADIKEFAGFASDSEALKASNAQIMQTQLKLEMLNRPTIAMVEGACVGGGCGLALACDMRVAAESAFFAITPAKLGLLYSHRDTRRLLALVGPSKTKELLFTGQRLSAQAALACGFINKLATTDDVQTVTDELAATIAANSQSAIRGIKTMLAGLEGVTDLSESEYLTLFDDAFSSADCEEGLAAFLDKRAAKFTWG